MSGNLTQYIDLASLSNSPDLKYFTIIRGETFLRIGVDNESYSRDFIVSCEKSLLRLRSDLKKYIQAYPLFRTSLTPVKICVRAPEIVRRMSNAAEVANVGPMAAVAGAIAECLGEETGRHCKELIIENGGDIYIRSSRLRVIAVFAAKSKFSYQIGIEVEGDGTPFGLCTSSGTIGRGMSFGNADAVVVKAVTPSLADAVATATANIIKTAKDLETAIRFASKLTGVTGILAIKDNFLAAWGDLKLVRI